MKTRILYNILESFPHEREAFLFSAGIVSKDPYTKHIYQFSLTFYDNDTKKTFFKKKEDV